MINARRSESMVDTMEIGEKWAHLFKNLQSDFASGGRIKKPYILHTIIHKIIGEGRMF